MNKKVIYIYIYKHNVLMPKKLYINLLYRFICMWLILSLIK